MTTSIGINNVCSYTPILIFPVCIVNYILQYTQGPIYMLWGPGFDWLHGFLSIRAVKMPLGPCPKRPAVHSGI